MQRCAFLHWLAIVCSQVLVACQTVPITGRSQLQLLSESDETRIRQIEQWMPGAFPYYQASPYRS